MSQRPVQKSQAPGSREKEHDPRQLRKACLTGVRAVSGGASAPGFTPVFHLFGLGARVLMVVRAWVLFVWVYVGDVQRGS